MVLLSPEKLEMQVANSTLAPPEKAAYLFLAVAGVSLFGRFVWLDPVRTGAKFNMLVTSLQLATVAVSIGITYAGMKKCYATNNDEKEFVQRFVCLSLPWTIFFSLTWVVITTVVSMVASMLLHQSIVFGQDK
jgi:hypothetical protein